MSQTKKIQQLFTDSLPLFNALGDPIRQQLILQMIDGNKKSVTELANRVGLSRPTVSHHLKLLKNAHILSEERVGRKTFYTPVLGNYFHPIRELVEIINTLEKV